MAEAKRSRRALVSTWQRGLGAARRRIVSDGGSGRRWLLPAAVIGSLLIGAGVGAGIVAGVTPVPTETEEYQDLEGRLERTIIAKDQDVDELTEDVANLRIEKGKLQTAASDVEDQQAAADARDAELTAREQAVGSVEAAKKSTEFGPGVYLVGTDIEPGQYRNTGSDSCYWERLRGTSGDFSDLIANDLPSGQAVVTILPSDVAFSSERCGTWSKIG
jgi:hypothetical protein